MRSRLFFAALLALSGMSVCAQTAQTAQPAATAYTGVAIAPSLAQVTNSRLSIDDHSFMAINVTLGSLLAKAWGIQENLVSGLPPETLKQRFNIAASVTATDPHAKQDRNAMLQTLLAEQFHLRAHMEKQNRPVFVLAVSDSGSRLAHATSPGDSSITIRNNHLTASSTTVSWLAHDLEGQLGRPVLDHTGLSGTYAVDLTWPPNSEVAVQPALTAALHDQLGLQLESAEAPVDTLVVDSIQEASLDRR